MVAVSASCCLLVLPYQHQNMSTRSSLMLCLFFFSSFLSSSPSPPPSSFFCLSSPVSLLLLHSIFLLSLSLALLLSLAAVSVSGPRASRKSDDDSCTCSCARSCSDHRRLHSSRCMQSTSAVYTHQASCHVRSNPSTASRNQPWPLLHFSVGTPFHGCSVPSDFVRILQEREQLAKYYGLKSVAMHLQNGHVSYCTARHIMVSGNCMPNDGCPVIVHAVLRSS